jgi:hypothetical protein
MLKSHTKVSVLFSTPCTATTSSRRRRCRGRRQLRQRPQLPSHLGKVCLFHALLVWCARRRRRRIFFTERSAWSEAHHSSAKRFWPFSSDTHIGPQTLTSELSRGRGRIPRPLLLPALALLLNSFEEEAEAVNT